MADSFPSKSLTKHFSDMKNFRFYDDRADLHFSSTLFPGQAELFNIGVVVASVQVTVKKNFLNLFKGNSGCHIEISYLVYTGIG